LPVNPAPLCTAIPSQVGKTAFNVGAGHFDGETAVGLSIAHAFTGNLLLSGSIARVSGGDAVSRVSVGFEF
jgi:YadA-like C-terminal region.